ncbi:Zinc ABC transporter, ATP-binding protein ZnuC [Chitinispirillum alkaliphilum]|nr:Zinc ABC transporter, ATP-binding protein ZnuC [Chitinispirillum alkaliphilum]
MSHLINVRDASFGYSSSGKLKRVVQGVNVTLSGGECVVLSGQNGCGKSTIIKGILGIAELIEGRVQLSIKREKIGYVPQESHLDHDTPATAIDIVRTASPFAWKKSKKEAANTLKLLGLSDKADCKYSNLSGGQRRRVLIARALMGSPEVLLLDEPTVYADRLAADMVETILLDLLKNKKIGIIAVTHTQSWERFAKVYDVAGGVLV